MTKIAKSLSNPRSFVATSTKFSIHLSRFLCSFDDSLFIHYEKRDIFPDYKKLTIKQITLCVYMIKLLQFDEKTQEGSQISLWYSVIRYKKAFWHFSFFRRSNSPLGELRLNEILKIDRLKNILYFWVFYRRCNVICFEYLRKITCLRYKYK